MFAQLQILALKFLSSTFSRFSNFMDLIFAPSSCRNSFSAKIHFCRFLVAFFIFLWYTVVLAVLCTLHNHQKNKNKNTKTKTKCARRFLSWSAFRYCFFCQQKFGCAPVTIGRFVTSEPVCARAFFIVTVSESRRFLHS